MPNTSIESRIDLGLIDQMLIDGDTQSYATLTRMRRAERTAPGVARRSEITRAERTAPGVARRVDD